VQSPLLASVVLERSELGRMMRMLRREGVRVSVYGDDIVVSDDNLERLTTAFALLERAAERAFFPLAEGKKQPPGPQITAFNLAVSYGRVEIAADRMEAYAAQVGQNGDCASSNDIIDYVAQVNASQAEELRALLRRQVAA
jgi:hypothetical protein